jgi:hypothetical protein
LGRSPPRKKPTAFWIRANPGPANTCADWGEKNRPQSAPKALPKRPQSAPESTPQRHQNDTGLPRLDSAACRGCVLHFRRWDLLGQGRDRDLLGHSPCRRHRHGKPTSFPHAWTHRRRLLYLSRARCAFRHKRAQRERSARVASRRIPSKSANLKSEFSDFPRRRAARFAPVLERVMHFPCPAMGRNEPVCFVVGPQRIFHLDTLRSSASDPGSLRRPLPRVRGGAGSDNATRRITRRL